jgi:hydrogenase maturation protease
MNGRLQEIVNAVLYEGYMLYPYRASSIKNQRERFTFGRVYPRWYSEGQGGVEPCLMQTECLVESETEQGTIEVTVRFLQPAWREVGVIDAELSNWEKATRNELRLVPELKVGENLYQTWQEAIEREAKVPVLNLAMCAAEKSPLIESYPFRFGCAESREPILDERGQVAGVLMRSNDTIEGQVEVAIHRVEQGLFKVTVRIKNESPSTQTESQLVDLGLAALMGTFASTHTILNSQGGTKFISLIDPPEKWREVAAGCENIGTWPVLVGDEESGERGTMQSSPIILYD